MFDLTRTDSNRIDIGNIDGYVLDMAFGADENNYTLAVGIDNGIRLDKGCLVYSLGTDYGGMVAGRKVDTASGIIHHKGLTWHGMLGKHVICPPRGSSHLSVSGDANAALAAIVGHLGIGDVFAASDKASGITVSHEFRYDYAYQGIVAMLSESAAKLKIEWNGERAVLSAEKIVDYSQDSEQADFVIDKDFLPFNHLVCIGIGEMEERLELHLYADGNGAVSQTQTFYGIFERTLVYDYSNADYDKLLEDGTKKLSELQSTDTIETSIAVNKNYDIGDIVGGYESFTGLSATAGVTKKIVRVINGEAEVSCEIGNITVSSGQYSVPSSGGGMLAYLQGEGIIIDGRTIKAEVTKKDLDGKASKSHSHDWESVTGKPSSFNPAAHSHDWESIGDKPDSFNPSAHNHDEMYYTEPEIDTKLSGKSDTSHSHEWNDIGKKPSSFPPEAHAHGWAEVQGKPDAFPPLDHSHPWGNITEKPDTFEPKDHAHAVATKDADGFMSAADKSIIESLSGGAVTGVKGESESEYRTGYVNLTAANVGAASTNRDGSIGANDANDQIAWSATVNGRLLTMYAEPNGFGLWNSTGSFGVWSIPTTAKARGLEAYPVGAVYMSWSSTSPASLFGGSWVAITGRFPYFNASTAAGGSNTHTLGVDEMPSHKHSSRYLSGRINTGIYNASYAGVQVIDLSDAWIYPETPAGGSQPHNNMPAYQSLYAWRRTA